MLTTTTKTTTTSTMFFVHQVDIKGERRRSRSEARSRNMATSQRQPPPHPTPPPVHRKIKYSYMIFFVICRDLEFHLKSIITFGSGGEAWADFPGRWGFKNLQKISLTTPPHPRLNAMIWNCSRNTTKIITEGWTGEARKDRAGKPDSAEENPRLPPRDRQVGNLLQYWVSLLERNLVSPSNGWEISSSEFCQSWPTVPICCPRA